MRYTRALTIFLAAAALVLSGCAGSDDSAPADGASAFNQADVTFAQQMIPHHRQAIQMARLANGRTGDPQVEKLAREIENAQTPEIETMQGWLQAWDQPTQQGSGDMGSMDDGGSGSMGHGESMNGMSGMASSDMQELRDARGAAFDEAFLTMMIEHHKGAIDMASTEEKRGTFPKAVAMAKQIQSDQATEINKMTALLEGSPR
jgi:uncharacterized protein (DUF305 family)